MRILMIALAIFGCSGAWAQALTYSAIYPQTGEKEVYIARQNNQVIYMKYSADGALLETGFYNGSEKDGLWQRFDTNGSRLEEMQYADGCKDGVRRVWNTYGELLYEVHYQNGVINKAYQYSKTGDVVAVR